MVARADGPRGRRKTALLVALTKCLPGLVKKISKTLFTTGESKSSSVPNEALAELQGVRVAYADEFTSADAL